MGAKQILRIPKAAGGGWGHLLGPVGGWEASQRQLADAAQDEGAAALRERLAAQGGQVPPQHQKQVVISNKRRV